ncbi:hypothetical protein D3C86_2001870 [compost metagenome]
MACWPSGATLWNSVTSFSLVAGTTSQEARAPSTTPLEMASVICAGGMLTGVAPRASRVLAAVRLEARSFRPDRSARVFTGLPRTCRSMPPSPNRESIL